MTTHAVVRASHFTLGAATADTVTFSEPGHAVRVTNRDATQVIYFRTDGTTAVSAADDTYVVPAGVGNTVVAGCGASRSVSLISSAGGACSVESFSNFANASTGASGSVSATVTNAGTFVVQENGTQVQVDDAAFTPATSKIVMAGFEADETATDSVDEGDGGAARMTLDRKVITTLQPHTSGGLSVFNATGADGSTILTNSAQAVKASAGQIYGWFLNNPNSSVSFFVFYNVASGSVTVGTTNPLFSLQLPATSAANVSFPNGIAFDTAITIAAATTAGGNGAPSTGCDATIFYK